MSKNSEEAKILKATIQNHLKELKPFLPRGVAEPLSKKYEMSITYVYDIMSGRRWNLEIAEELLKIGQQRETRAKKVEKGLKELLDKKRKATS